MNTARRTLSFLLAAFAIAGLSGCNNTTNDAPDFPEHETLNPGQAIPKEANLELAGTLLNVQMARKTEGSQISYQLSSNGAKVGQEVYEDLPHQFSIIQTGEESYADPLPILKFPMSSGDSWTWTGYVQSGGAKRTANAVVTINKDMLHVGQQQYDCVRSEARVSINNENSPTTVFRLSFWFSEKDGLIKREFGPLSIRTVRVP